ncbi:hypothetical protein [Pantoea agglomerans]|uniref:Uncharacterized protein n=1 Tax=Enterobacter agglomerans TaxID=549 RepID=A0ACC5RK35_ENTAG|nr:hypothetical protein [Pantoea agglomerans]MBK4724974.1 hypothetical protein [Pantoea agglomerans]
MDLFSQLNQFRGVLFFTFFMLCSDAIAGYNHIVWVHSSLKPEISIAPFGNDKYVSDLTVTPVSGHVSMKALDAECVDFELATKKMTTQWIMFPSKGEYKGLKWSLKMNSAGAGGPYSGSELGGSANDMLVPFSQVTVPAADTDCFHTGQQYAWTTRPEGVVTGSLILDPAMATPGEYNFNIPLVWAIEENKYSGSYIPMWHYMGALLGKEPKMQVPVSFTLKSKCVFNTNDITLKHGDISLDAATKIYPSDIYSLDISCARDNVSVKVELIGSAPVSGKTSNYTSCGKGGDCRLTFDANGKVDLYSETLSINKTTAIVNVKSSYIPNAKPVAGKFEGSAILRITIL